MLSNGHTHTHTQTDRHTDPTTVTLAAHARRGLIIKTIVMMIPFLCSIIIHVPLLLIHTVETSEEFCNSMLNV